MILSERFEKAVVYAVRIHSLQKRKGTDIPYISHIFGVASIAIEHGASEEEAIAALLHDAVEDAGGKPRLEDITARFGQNVAGIVLGCTDADSIPKPPWHERKEGYIRHLMEADDSTLFVSASDKLHNARAILRDYRQLGDDLWKRFKVGKEDELWYYRSLTNVFVSKPSARLTPLSAELDRTVSELEMLARKS